MPLYIKGYKSRLSSKIMEIEKSRDFDEGMRLFYVAMTRAQDELYICGYKNDKKSTPEKSWYKIAETAMKDIHNSIYQDENGNNVYRLEAKGKGGHVDDSTARKNTHDGYLTIDKPAYLSEAPEFRPQTVKVMIPSETGNKPAVNSEAVERGRMIHYLLEILPSVPADKRYEIAVRYLEKNPFHNKDNIIREVLSVLEDKRFSFLFDLPAKVEVPVTGKFEDYIIPGQIDRLVYEGKKIHLLDYKTSNRVPKSVESVPDSYINQMRLYKRIIQDIYPERQISCYLLWTHSLTIYNIDCKLDNMVA